MAFKSTVLKSSTAFLEAQFSPFEGRNSPVTVGSRSSLQSPCNSSHLYFNKKRFQPLKPFSFGIGAQFWRGEVELVEFFLSSSVIREQKQLQPEERADE